jgi:hypothetical protein
MHVTRGPDRPLVVMLAFGGRAAQEARIVNCAFWVSEIVIENQVQIFGSVRTFVVGAGTISAY